MLELRKRKLILFVKDSAEFLVPWRSFVPGPKTDLINIQARYKVHYFQAWLLPSYHRYFPICYHVCRHVLLFFLVNFLMAIYALHIVLGSSSLHIADVRYKTCAAFWWVKMKIKSVWSLILFELSLGYRWPQTTFGHEKFIINCLQLF